MNLITGGNVVTYLNECDLIELKNSLNYEKESITKKTLLENDIQTIAGFAFDRGQSVFPCKSPMNVTLHILEGNAEVMIAGQNYDISEGEKIFMPKDKIHALFAKTKLKLALVKN